MEWASVFSAFLTQDSSRAATLQDLNYIVMANVPRDGLISYENFTYEITMQRFFGVDRRKWPLLEWKEFFDQPKFFPTLLLGNVGMFDVIDPTFAHAWRDASLAAFPDIIKPAPGFPLADVYIFQRHESPGSLNGRNFYNLDQVVDHVKSFGWSVAVVSLNESVSALHQAQLFNQAKTIISPHGSQMISVIFSQPGLRFIEVSAICTYQHWTKMASQFGATVVTSEGHHPQNASLESRIAHCIQTTHSYALNEHCFPRKPIQGVLECPRNEISQLAVTVDLKLLTQDFYKVGLCSEHFC